MEPGSSLNRFGLKLPLLLPLLLPAVDSIVVGLMWVRKWEVEDGTRAPCVCMQGCGKAYSGVSGASCVRRPRSRLPVYRALRVMVRPCTAARHESDTVLELLLLLLLLAMRSTTS